MSRKYPHYGQQPFKLDAVVSSTDFPDTEDCTMSDAGVTLLHDPVDGECRYCAKLVGETNEGEPCDGAKPLRKALLAIAHDSRCPDTRAVARYALGLGEDAPMSEESERRFSGGVWCNYCGGEHAPSKCDRGLNR